MSDALLDLSCGKASVFRSPSKVVKGLRARFPSDRELRSHAKVSLNSFTPLSDD